MKRIIALLLAVGMVLSLTACGTDSDSTAQTSAPASEASAEVSAQEPTAPAEESSTPEPSAPAEASAEETPASSVDSAPAAVSTEGAEETVILDNEICTVTLKSIDPDNMWGYTWNVLLENKTEQNLMFSLDDVSVNGVMCDPFWATAVSAGMSANSEISWDSEDFALSGITEATVVEFQLTVYDDDNLNMDYLVDQVFTVYPLGEDAATTVEYTPKDSDVVLFDNDSCSMIVTGYEPDNEWGYTVNVYLLNKTDTRLMFTVDGASVNDFMCDPFWATTVSAGKAAYSQLTWSSEDFETNGITEVEKITLPVTVYDDTLLLSDDIVSETFTLEP